jgi:hypothetical protein
MITSRAVSALLLHHYRRVVMRRAVNYDFAGALGIPGPRGAWSPNFQVNGLVADATFTHPRTMAPGTYPHRAVMRSSGRAFTHVETGLMVTGRDLSHGDLHSGESRIASAHHGSRIIYQSPSSNP